jgi:hypothetical protein
MNIYLITEGKTEAVIYECWVPFLNNSIVPVFNINDVVENNMLIVSAKGYPDYFQIISDAIDDINATNLFDRLVIVIDSEEMTKEEKFQEIINFTNQFSCSCEIKIIVQHFCVETWALANRKIIRKNTKSSRLRAFKKIHNVLILDPELLPANKDLELSRAKFAELYLKVALNDRYKQLTYTKSRPIPLLNQSYYEQVKNRFEQTSHIPSFEDFLHAFR